MMPFAAFAIAACFAVAPGSDQILARDLAPYVAGFGGLPPDALVSLAPGPGLARVFTTAELVRVAAKFQVVVTPDAEVCAERPAAVLDAATLLAVMQRQLPDAKIELLDFSKARAPLGEIEFPIEGLRYRALGSLWAGSVRYAGNRRFPIWAKVNAAIATTHVLANRDLMAGQRIAAIDLTVTPTEEFPTAHHAPTAADEVVGTIARIGIRAGATIRWNAIDKPKDVMRGDTVRVAVSNGAAHIDLDAVAEGSGDAGAKILVRNPSSNKLFFARVQGKGQVVVSGMPGPRNP